MTPEEKRLDKYYLKKFGWTLAEVNAMFEAQGNVCAACYRPPGERRMSVDHDHAFDRVKPKVAKRPDKSWEAFAMDPKGYLQHSGDRRTRSEAIKNFRIRMRRESVRQGLCLRCNKGLQMFEDLGGTTQMLPALRLENLAASLRKFAASSRKS